MASITDRDVATAPKIPPSISTDSMVESRRPVVAAAVASVTKRQSNPRSFASRMVLDTQTSVVTPTSNRFLIPRIRRTCSKSVWANAPRPGLSIIISSGKGLSSGITSCPTSPRMRNLPSGPLSPMPNRRGLLRERKRSRLDKVERSGRCPVSQSGSKRLASLPRTFSSEKDWERCLTGSMKKVADGLDDCSGVLHVISLAVEITTNIADYLLFSALHRLSMASYLQSRCISMITSAVVAGLKEASCGHG